MCTWHMFYSHTSMENEMMLVYNSAIKFKKCFELTEAVQMKIVNGHKI